MNATLKAQFQRVDLDGSLLDPVIPVTFNPTEYTLNKGVQVAEIAIPGLDSPILQFVRGQSETLTLDLFFDSTDSGMDESATSPTFTEPERGSSMPASSRPSVDFPAPDGPTMASRSPGWMVSEMPRSTSCPLRYA